MAEHCSEIRQQKLFRICRSKSGLVPDKFSLGYIDPDQVQNSGPSWKACIPFTWSQNVRNTSGEDTGIRSRSMSSKRSRVFYVVVPQGLKSASPLLSSKSPLSLEESLTTQLPPQKCIGNFPAVDFVISSNDAIIADSNPQMQRSAPLASPQVQSPYLAISTLLRQQHCSPTKLTLNFLTKSPKSPRGPLEETIGDYIHHAFHVIIIPTQAFLGLSSFGDSDADGYPDSGLIIHIQAFFVVPIKSLL